MIIAAAPSASNALAAHFWHGVAAVAFVGIAIGGTALGERHSARKQSAGNQSAPTRSPRQWGPGLLSLAALSCAAAAVVHLVVMPEHFREAALYGTFFLVTATVQLGYAVALVTRPTPPMLISGALANGAVVGLWLVTRLVAIPLGPAAGSREAFGGLDILASGFEVLFIAAAILLLHRPLVTSRRVVKSLLSPAVAGFAMVAIASIVATTLVAPPS